MGGIGSSYPLPDRWHFLGGVLLASFVWFFGLSLFGRTLAPVLSKPGTWKVAQVLVCLVLWFQAGTLALYVAERIGALV